MPWYLGIVIPAWQVLEDTTTLTGVGDGAFWRYLPPSLVIARLHPQAVPGDRPLKAGSAFFLQCSSRNNRASLECYSCGRIAAGSGGAMSQICVRTKSIFSVLIPLDIFQWQVVDRPIAFAISQAR